VLRDVDRPDWPPPRDLLVAEFVNEGLRRAGAQVVLIPHGLVMCLQTIMEAI
jgi:hypothetical protein